jgi:mono/diheme cytochrome c family protein
MFRLPRSRFGLRPSRFFQFALLAAAVSIAFSPLWNRAMRASAENSKAQNSSAQHPSKASGAAPDVARGKYLVEGVARCGQCHTPLDSDGNPDPKRPLQGAPVPFLSPNRDPNWPLSAPRIGGTPPADDADMVKLLMTGIWTTGTRLRAPMPQFRMDRGDAEAVVAYLKSLTPQE